MLLILSCREDSFATVWLAYALFLIAIFSIDYLLLKGSTSIACSFCLKCDVVLCYTGAEMFLKLNYRFRSSRV